MAASLPQPSLTPERHTQKLNEPSAALAIPAHAYLARLAALHDEAAEIAHLANLLGRTPWVAAALGGATIASALAAWSSASTMGLVTWLLLMAAGVVAILRAHQWAIQAPFERAALRGFARDLSAALLYTGFAWGAGLFLVLPATIGLAACLVFAAGLSVVLAGVLRARDVTFCFLVPATAMGAFAALMRPLEGNVATMLAILVVGLAVAAATAVLERMSSPTRASLASG